MATPAPDCDTSMIRQVRLRPLQDQAADRIARNDAAVPAVFGQAEDMAIGEPGELRGEFVALARRRRDRHGKTVLKDARDMAFDPPQVIDVGDHALARLAGDWRNQRDAARRHVDDLTRKLAPVGKHVAAGEVHAYALQARWHGHRLPGSTATLVFQGFKRYFCYLITPPTATGKHPCASPALPQRTR